MDFGICCNGFGASNGGAPFFEWEKQFFLDLQVLLSQVVLNQEAMDHIIWKHHYSGVYSMKSFVNLANNVHVGQMESRNTFSNIWQGLAHPRTEFLVWFTMLGRLETKVWLHKMKILEVDNLRCVFCKAADETV